MENPKLTPLIRLVDDDRNVLESEAYVLQLDGWETASYESAEAFLAEDDPERPGCMVLDVRMGGMNGLTLQRKLSESGRTLPILFLSGHADVETAVLAMKRGAADFRTKPISPELLQKTVARLVRWHVAVCRSARETAKLRALFDSLTPREQEVARLAAKGLLNTEIADLVEASEATVKIHRANAFRKLDVRNAAELTEILGMIDAPELPAFPSSDKEEEATAEERAGSLP